MNLKELRTAIAEYQEDMEVFVFEGEHLYSAKETETRTALRIEYENGRVAVLPMAYPPPQNELRKPEPARGEKSVSMVKVLVVASSL